LAVALNATVLPTGTLRLHHRGPIAGLPGFNDGAWWVQDMAAALPARLLGDVRDRNVVDLCAAPGGKTAQLAATGAHVTAVDRVPERLRKLENNLARLRLRAETVAADAREWRPAQPADAVIVDVPCSATGTIRRHPDVAWLKRSGDVASLVPIQERLLAAAADMVKPGGLLVYCSCSLQPEEGPGQIDAFLIREPSFRRVPVTPGEVGGLGDLITPGGDLRTLPCHLAGQGGMDGFFAARLRCR
jgi:16S rRNA (cytosine967-C5)-methyltransferase